MCLYLVYLCAGTVMTSSDLSVGEIVLVGCLDFVAYAPCFTGSVGSTANPFERKGVFLCLYTDVSLYVSVEHL